MEDTALLDIQRMAVLKSIDIFRELDIESLYQVLKIARYTRFKMNELIIRKGEAGDSFYIVLEGKVGVFAELNREMITTITRGGIIGELGILEKKERTAYVVALGDTLILEFNGDEFINLIKMNNAVALSMAGTLSQRIRNTLYTADKDK